MVISFSWTCPTICINWSLRVAKELIYSHDYTILQFLNRDLSWMCHHIVIQKRLKYCWWDVKLLHIKMSNENRAAFKSAKHSRMLLLWIPAPVSDPSFGYKNQGQKSRVFARLAQGCVQMCKWLANVLHWNPAPVARHLVQVSASTFQWTLDIFFIFYSQTIVFDIYCKLSNFWKKVEKYRQFVVCNMPREW